MKKIKLLIWGTSGHALVVRDIIDLNKRYEIAGYLDDMNPDRHGKIFFGAPVLGGREQLENLCKKGIDHLIIAIGDCGTRLKLSLFAAAKGFKLITVAHPKSIIARDVCIGDGTVIAAGAVINPEASVGRSVIINTSAIVDHECRIEDGAHIGPGVCLGGAVHVGEGSWIGIGATIKDHIKVGANAVVGAGSVVVHDLPDNVVAYGVPAKIQHRNS